jgi:phosphopantothenoylcysteine decarboxylase/phosphopantothenate--cysteine ligase
MPDPEVLFEHIYNEIAYEKTLMGKKILVTAGPTEEALDPVRYISNHSTGKMGYAIAKVAAAMGASVTLVTGPTSIAKPIHANIIDIKSAEDMFRAVTNHSGEADIIIKAAAVADYTPVDVSDDKLKKKDGDMSIPLKRTKDILAYLGEHKKENQFLCGFSMETQDMLENSKAKLEKKNLDMIVANNLKVEGAGFGVDTNVVTLITKKEIKELPILSKEEVAYRLLTYIAEKINE